jgi:hypothetical protein
MQQDNAPSRSVLPVDVRVCWLIQGFVPGIFADEDPRDTNDRKVDVAAIPACLRESRPRGLSLVRQHEPIHTTEP